MPLAREILGTPHGVTDDFWAWANGTANQAGWAFDPIVGGRPETTADLLRRNQERAAAGGIYADFPDVQTETRIGGASRLPEATAAEAPAVTNVGNASSLLLPVVLIAVLWWISG